MWSFYYFDLPFPEILATPLTALPLWCYFSIVELYVSHCHTRVPLMLLCHCHTALPVMLPPRLMVLHQNGLACSCQSMFPLLNYLLDFMPLCCCDNAVPLSLYIATVMQLDTIMLSCHSYCCLNTHSAAQPCHSALPIMLPASFMLRYHCPAAW